MKKNIRVDASCIYSIEDFYDQIESELHLKRFGRNLDALYDVLSDLGASDCIIEDYALFRGRLGRDYTISYYKERIGKAQNQNEIQFLEDTLSLMEEGSGETIAERVLGTFKDIATIKLYLED